MSRNDPTSMTFNKPNPPVQQFRPINRTIVNQPVVDSTIIAKLFLLCIEGKVTPIKEYIIKNGLTVNDMVDTNGESILHKVLQNENLTKRDKIELFRFFEEKNLLKMSFDGTQSSPLHIAVKMQIKEIIEILLRAGHNINALDANNKTPLFYAVSGKTQECPPKKEKTLLEKTKFKLESSDTYQLIQELIKVINNEKSLYDAFLHINNTTGILDQIYSKSITDILEKDNKKIVDILNTTDSESVKINKIFNLISDTKMAVANLLIKNELQSTFKPIELQQNTVNGWGPNSNPQNKIMKNNNVNDYLNKLMVDIDGKIKKNLSQTKENTKNLFIYYANIFDNYIQPVLKVLNEFSYEYQNLYHLASIGESTIGVGVMPDITDPAIIDLYKSDIPDPITFMQRNLDDNNNIDVTANRTSVVTTTTKPDYTIVPKHSRERTALRTMLEDVTKNPNLAGLVLRQINGGEYYIKSASVIYEEIVKLLNTIRTSMININTNLDGDFNLIDSESILKNCVIIQNNILGLLHYLPLIIDELKIVGAKNDKFINNIQINLEGFILNKTVNGSTPRNVHDTSKYFNEVLENATELFSDFDPLRMKDMFQDIYNFTRTYYLSLNNIIDLLNDINATKYMIYYYNYFIDFDRFFTNNQTETIQNIFHNKLSLLNDVPSKIENFQTLLSTNVIQNKRFLIEQYLYQIHSKSFTSYYTDPVSSYYTAPSSSYTGSVSSYYTGLVSRLPRIGFLLDDTTGINNVSAGVPLNLAYGETSPDPTVLENADTSNFAGLIGKMIPLKKRKRDEVVPIIGSKLSEHFNIIKYYIIRYLLKLSYDLLDNKIKGVAVAPIYTNYTDLIFKMYNNLMTKLQLNPNDLSTLLIIIGSCVDKIVSSNIQESIMKGINRFSYKTNRNAKTDQILTLLAQIKTKDFSVMSKDNFDISNYLKDTKFLVEDTKSVVKKIIKTTQSEYLYDYAEDIFEKKVSDSKIFKKFSQNIIDNDPTSCYSLDYDIIDLLISNKANIASKDKEGSTVIFSAIDMNNIELVEKFVNLLPVYNKHSKNIFGITPLEHSLKYLMYFNKMYLDKQIIHDLISISNDIVSKKTQVTMQLRYHSEIYKIILILINHYIYTTGKEYINGWTHSKQQSLDNFLEMGKFEIPLLETLKNLDITSRDKFVKDFAESDIDINTKLKQKVKDIKTQIATLMEERSTPTITPIRAKMIDQIVANLNANLASAELSNIDTNIADMTTVKNNIDLTKLASVNAVLVKNTEANVTTDNLITIYESIQDRIINNTKYSLNNDYKTYINLWKESIKNNDYKDINVIDNISTFIGTHTQIQNIPEMLLIRDYFNSIISKLALDYNELDYAYNGNNYVLNNFVKIIKHVLSNTVGVNLLNIIQQLLREELRIKHPYDKDSYTDEVGYTKLLDQKIKKIFETATINGISLDSYIMDELIEKVIKIYFNLYEDSYDKDNMEDINTIFMKINKLLEANVVLSLSTVGRDSDTSQIMKELKEKIYPYFKDYLETNLKLIKRFIDGYMNSLINYNNSLNIYCILLNKGFEEYKIGK